jgi:hypothetical protein
LASCLSFFSLSDVVMPLMGVFLRDLNITYPRLSRNAIANHPCL